MGDLLSRVSHKHLNGGGNNAAPLRWASGLGDISYPGKQWPLGRAVYISSCQHTGIYNSFVHSCALIHSMSLGTDGGIMLVRYRQQTTARLNCKDLTSLPRHTKSPDHSNMFHLFHNNTYSDFRRVYKHVLISSYIIRVICQNQNITKLNINWLLG